MVEFAAFLRAAETNKKVQVQQAKDRAFQRIRQTSALAGCEDLQAGAAVPPPQLVTPAAAQTPAPAADAASTFVVERYDDF
jgi:hypothetical protein